MPTFDKSPTNINVQSTKRLNKKHFFIKNVASIYITYLSHFEWPFILTKLSILKDIQFTSTNKSSSNIPASESLNLISSLLFSRESGRTSTHSTHWEIPPFPLCRGVCVSAIVCGQQIVGKIMDSGVCEINGEWQWKNLTH